MTRYVGRHRAPTPPRTAPLRLAALSLGGAGALTLLPSGVAEAAPDWGPIIACESGGRNVEGAGPGTASGYFQFLDSTWRNYGGTKYAPRAIQATGAQQLAIANVAYAARGFDDWNESRYCWATRRKGSATIPGLGVAAAPTAKPATPKATPKATPAPKVTPKPRATAPSTTAKPKPRAVTPRVVAPAPRVATGDTAIPNGYVIQRGDTLSALAQRFAVPGGYQAIAKANGIGNPNLIYAGATLR
jgi:LysM repeat protein